MIILNLFFIMKVFYSKLFTSLLALFVCMMFSHISDIYASETPSDKKEKNVNYEFAQSIDIIGFEKRISDTNELYIIRNNTENTITLIKLRVYYKTPKGEMLDYRDVVLTGELLPNTTKHFETPSFDRGKRYYYLEGNLSNKKPSGYPFIITYDLLRYDIAITE